MGDLSLRGLVKVYPYTKASGRIFGRKQAKAALEQQKRQPYTTDEGVLAVRGFSLDVAGGEFVVLLGPSGCGKSTVLRMIAGLESVSAGDILLDGRSIVDMPPEQRDIAMIFQNYSLYPNYTVYENMAFPLKNQHLPRAQIDSLVREAASLLELEGLLDRRPKDLSGGQRQRAAIGRALVRRPRLFLMDEPFSNLDATLRQKLRQVVKGLHWKLGTTFLYVTHDQMEAFALGDRVVVMRHGAVEQAGTPQELFNCPANLYTASFVGAPPMNLVEDVPLQKRGDSWQVSLYGHSYVLPRGKCAGLTGRDHGRQVTLGIRSAYVAVGAGELEATVDFWEVMGAELHLHLRIAGAALTAVAPAAGLGVFARGQKVAVGLPPKRFHLFDPKTEERIL